MLFTLEKRKALSIKLPIQKITLLVESLAGRNFSGNKLSRTPLVKIRFRGYKLSRRPSIFPLFLYFRAVFRIFRLKFRDLVDKVQFRGD